MITIYIYISIFYDEDFLRRKKPIVYDAAHKLSTFFSHDAQEIILSLYMHRVVTIVFYCIILKVVERNRNMLSEIMIRPSHQLSIIESNYVFYVFEYEN